MKSIAKKLSALAVAACALVGCCSLSACGSTDYTKYTWDDFAKISYSDWNKKEISYQMYTEESVALGFNLFAHVCMNLYSDGSMIYFVAGLYTTPSTMKDSVWYDQDNHISWASFGVWEEEDNTITTYFMNYFASKYDATYGTKTTIEKSAEWAAFEGEDDAYTGRYSVKFTKENGEYVYKKTESQYMPLGAANDRGEGMVLEAQLAVRTTVKYKTIEEWIESYGDEPIDQA